jgi:hypothetical protein
MSSLNMTRVVLNANVVSGILNWVCPGCGGRMGGRGKEFKCQGECQTDWRQVWEEVLSERRSPDLVGVSKRFAPDGDIQETVEIL